MHIEEGEESSIFLLVTTQSQAEIPELAQPEAAMGQVCEIRAHKSVLYTGSFSLAKLPQVSQLEIENYICTNNSFQCFNYLSLQSLKCTFSIKLYIEYFKLCQPFFCFKCIAYVQFLQHVMYRQLQIERKFTFIPSVFSNKTKLEKKN